VPVYKLTLVSGLNISFERRLLRLATNDAFTGFMEVGRGVIFGLAENHPPLPTLKSLLSRVIASAYPKKAWGIMRI